MLKFLYKKLFVVAITICLYSPVSAGNYKTKLRDLLKQITEVKTDISQKEKQRVSVERQLKNLKIKTQTLEVGYKTTTKNLKKQKNVLTKLNDDQTKQQLKLQKVQREFATQMVAAYQLESPNYLKSIFKQDHEQISDLFLTYHKYIFIARLDQIQFIKKTLSHIENNKQKIKKQVKILATLENKQKQQKQDLVQTQQTRNQLLSSLKSKIITQNQKLKHLISAKKNLERLINKLSPYKKIVISPQLMGQLCHDFVWPTKGAITIHFGSPIEQSSWSWSGIIISAPEYQEIHAVSAGKVVYSDWFTGYGLLLIIDHGSGYMSLYGHNSKFYKSLGAKVRPGEIVATVGKSGCEKPQLYFAIRYNGQPVDPERWCK